MDLEKAENYLSKELGFVKNTLISYHEVIKVMVKYAESEAINYSRCCKSDSELLPDAEKEKLINDAYWLNLQNLSGREDFEEAFRLGIETGVDETLEKLQG